MFAFGLKVPWAPLQVPPVATVTAPLRAMLALLAQSTPPVPASAVGMAVKVMSTSSVTAWQAPLPMVVSVRVSVPAAISAAVGVYTAFSEAMLGAKVPAPPLHWPPPAPVTEPPSCTTALLEQTAIGAPASATGAGRMVMVIWSVTGRQSPFWVEVRVSVTVPRAISAGLGV